MLKLILFTALLSILIYQNIFAQTKKFTDSFLNKSTFNKIRFESAPKCDSTDAWAKSDIHNQTIFLFIQGGIAPVIYNTDNVFEKKYSVYFADFGDLGVADESCIVKYNTIIFEYLIKNFGNKWLKEMRKDVIGFKTWKKKNRKNFQHKS